MTTQNQIPTWRDALLPIHTTIQRAIKCLDETGLQIVLVTTEDGLLYGTITDGDIRRAILKGHTLQSEITEIVHRQPLVAPPDLSRKMVLQLMQANRVHQLPVIDHDRRIIDLHIWDEIITPTSRENPMIIMAGGKGTRLRPHTEECPKPMLEVAGKPMLEHIIERAKGDGFTDFILAVHYLREVVEDYFGDGQAFGINVSYIHEETPLGTAGALSLIKEPPKVPFIVTNGDVLADVRYGEILEFHSRHNAAATMAVRDHELQNPFGVVKTQGVDIVGFEEKPIHKSHINAGIYALDPEALKYLEPGQHCNMPTLFTRIKDQNLSTIVYPMHEPWLDVGRPDDLALARQKRK